MVRNTSQQAYNNLVANKVLPKRRREAYAYLYINGPCTAMQVEQGAGSRHINKRLSELRDMGVIEELGETTCPITGKQAILWDVTALVFPRTLQKAPVRVTRKQLEQQLRDALSRIAELEVTLSQYRSPETIDNPNVAVDHV
jgi:hypothetical protein